MIAKVNIPDDVATALKGCKPGETLTITMKLDSYEKGDLMGTASEVEKDEPEPKPKREGPPPLPDDEDTEVPIRRTKTKMPPMVEQDMGGGY